MTWTIYAILSACSGETFVLAITASRNICRAINIPLPLNCRNVAQLS
jgi:hypothetical protein